MTERIIRVGVDPTGVETGTRRVDAALDKTDKKAASLGKNLRVLFAASAVTGFVVALARTSDEFTNIQNRLGLVTDSQSELISLNGQILASAQRSRVAFADQADLFSKLVQASGELGASQADTLRFTEAVSKSFAISGTSAAAAAGSTQQLAQALSSGTLRGDELNSILEGNARLARGLAEEMGVGVGELRKLGESGKLVSRDVFQAILDQAEKINEEFKKTAPTIGSGFTQIGNAITTLVGEIGRVTGAGGAFAELLEGVAKGITGIVPDAVEFFGGMKAVVSGVFGFIDEGVTRFRLALAGLRVNYFEFYQETLATVAKLKLPGPPIGLNIDATGVQVQPLQLTLPGVPLPPPAVAEVSESAKALGAARNDVAILTKELAQLERAQTELSKRQAKEVADLAAQLRIGARAGLDEAPGVAKARGESDAEKKAREEREKAAKKEAEDAQKLLLSLQQESAELRIQEESARSLAQAYERFREQALGSALSSTDFLTTIGAIGRDAEEAITRVGQASELSEITSQGLLATLRAASEEVITRQRALQQAKDVAADEEFLAALERELDLLKLTNKEREVDVALRKLSESASEGQRSQVEKLTTEIARLTEVAALQQELAKNTAQGIQSAFSDFLFDPFEDGLKGMVTSFVMSMKRIASEILANLLLKKLFETLGGAAGGPIGAFFSTAASTISAPGGRQHGGGVSGGVPYLIGEQGPELFVPRDTGAVRPLGRSGGRAQESSTVVEMDPRSMLAVIESARGRDAVRRVIQADAAGIRRLLGA